MRSARIYNHLTRHSIRYIVAVIVCVVFLRWMNKKTSTAPSMYTTRAQPTIKSSGKIMPTMPAPMTVSEINAVDFFEKEFKTDALGFTWAHAVNEYSKLKDALKAKFHGIEADVVFRHEGTDAQEMLPIMAHPPNYVSDLTLRSFLHETLLGNSVIKLDFKSIAPVEMSLQLLSEVKDQIRVPVWLNADILQGPGDAPPSKVPADTFLQKVMSGFNHCTLSVGWTTSTTTLRPYSWANMYQMSQAIHRNIPNRQGKHLTFPVNASLLKDSIIPLKWLCEQYDASLTVWQSQPDAPVEVEELIYLRKLFPKTRIYYDLLPETMDKFRKVADSESLTRQHVHRERYAYQPKEWIIKVTDKSSDMKIGEDVVWLSGPNAQIMSSRKIPKEHTVMHKGTVSFLSKNVSAPTENVKSNIQMFFFGTDHTGGHPSGIRCSIDSSGRMILASDHVNKAEIYVDEHVGISPGSCYQFQVKVNGYYIEFTAAPLEYNCNYNNDNKPKGKTLKMMLDLYADKLVIPYSVVVRNSRTEGYAILEQLYYWKLDGGEI